MIHYTKGDIFDVQADIRVNTVNCVGVMGAGVALAFKNRYQGTGMFNAYKRDCQSGKLRPGRPTVWSDSHLGGAIDTVIQFPTKDHWREPSEYSYVEDGLKWLRAYLKKQGRISLSLPALGCGHGGLNWSKVKKMIEDHLGDLEATIYVFEPSSSHLVGKKSRPLTDEELDEMELAGVEKLSTNQAFLPKRFQNLGSEEIYYKGNLGVLSRNVLGLFMSSKAKEREMNALSFCFEDLLKAPRTVAVGYSGAPERIIIRKVLENNGCVVICPVEGLLNFKVRKDIEEIWDESRILLLSAVRPSSSWAKSLFAKNTELRAKISDALFISDQKPIWSKKIKTEIQEQSKYLTYIRYGDVSPVFSGLNAVPIAKKKDTGRPNIRALRLALGDDLPEEIQYNESNWVDETASRIKTRVENAEKMNAVLEKQEQSGAEEMPKEETEKTPAKKAAKKKASKKKAVKKQKSMEETLWDSANKLRGSVEPSEYKHVVLSLIFLKFASEKFEHRKQELIDEGKEKYVDMVEFYTMKNVFYLPEECRWGFIKKHAKQDDIAVKIDSALHTVEKNNKALKGALPDNYFSRLGLDVSKLAALIDTINNIHTLKDKEQDVVGRVYEYFLGKFAASEGKGGGEFYTPKCVVKLLVEMLEPFRGKIYDPACGSGGMFVQSKKFVESHHGNAKDIAIYGQEYTGTTYKLAKMNLAIRGIAANLGEAPADTFGNDQHKDLKADYIIANPPFNQKDWRGANELVHDPRWAGFEMPPTSNANYAWILHMLSKLSETGKAGFVLANGAMSSNVSSEGEIRKKLIERDLVDCMISLPGHLFYNMYSQVCLWFLRKDKRQSALSNRCEQILFIDAAGMGEMEERTHRELSDDDVAQIADTYHLWCNSEADDLYKDIPGFCRSASTDLVRRRGYNLMPARYVGSVDMGDTSLSVDVALANLSELLTPLANEMSRRGVNLQENLNYLVTGKRPEKDQSALSSDNSGLGFNELTQKLNTSISVLAKTLFRSWFVDFEPVYSNAGSQKALLPQEIENLFPREFGDSSFGEIPKGWRVGTFREILEPSSEKVGSRSVAEYSATVRGLELRELRFNKQLAKAQNKNKLIQKNDLVFGLSRRVINFGLMTDEWGSVSPVYEIFHVNTDLYIPELLELYIRFHMRMHMDILKAGAREGAPIDRTYLLSKEVLIPDISVQKRFHEITIGAQLKL